MLMWTLGSSLAGLGLALLAGSAQAQTPAPGATPAVTSPASTPAARHYPPLTLGITLGYGAPYGWGVDVSGLVAPKLDVGLGVGFSITGGKIGLGTRYYFSPERKVSPFAGANFVHNSGLNHVTFTNNGSSTGSSYNRPSNETVVNFKASNLLHLRGGVRWQPTFRFAMIGALGYGIMLGGDPVEYVAGDTSPKARDLVNIFSPGGLELSVGVMFGLGHRD